MRDYLNTTKLASALSSLDKHFHREDNNIVYHQKPHSKPIWHGKVKVQNHSLIRVCGLFVDIILHWGIL